jgi:hypothetical protein
MVKGGYHMFSRLARWWSYWIEFRFLTAWYAFFFGIPLVRRIPGFVMIALTAILAVCGMFWSALVMLVIFLVHMDMVTTVKD